MAKKIDIFFNEQVQELIDSFAYCFNVKITVFSAEMEELVVGLQNPGSNFCRLIQKKLRFRHRCLGQDKLMCEKCSRRGNLIVYHCYAGLSESVIPIKLNDSLIGYGMLGQFRTSKALPEETKQAWKKAGLDLEQLREAFLAQPYFDKPALDNMLKLFSMLITYVVTREYVTVRRPGLAESVVNWLEEHISEPPDLNAVAAAMNRSRSTISHSVKKQLGLSFSQLSIIKRIRRFESIVNADPDISIREAASRVGYDDPLYFSRLYKKMRLVSPSEYVRSVREMVRGEDG